MNRVSLFTRSRPICRLLSSRNAVIVDRILPSTAEDKKLSVTWSDNKTTTFPYVYLLDNDPTTEGRMQLTTAELHSDVKPQDVQWSARHVTIKWNNGKQMSYPVAWLSERRHAYGATKSEDLVETEYWDEVTFHERPRYDLQRLQREDEYLLQMLLQFQSHGFAILENCGTESDVRMKLAKLVNGGIRPTYVSGAKGFNMNKVSVDIWSSNSVAYLPKRLNLHTDIPVYNHPLEAMIIHCSKQIRGEGGDSWLSDGFRAAEQLRKENPEHFKLLCNVPVHWKDAGAEPNTYPYSLESWHPTISVDGDGRLKVIRMSDHMRGSQFSSHHQDKLIDWYDAYFNFCNIVNLDRFIGKYKMRSGDALLFDNRRLLHGRKGFMPSPDDSRVLFVYHCFWVDVVKTTKSLKRRLSVL